jgi:hypothetical protein
VDQAHEQIADMRSVFRFKKEGIFPMDDGLFQKLSTLPLTLPTAKARRFSGNTSYCRC